MTDHKKAPFIPGDRYWWLGIILLFLLVFLFSKEFINGGINEIINDPLYFFSILMVGLVVAAPIVWIFNQGMVFLSEKSRGRSKADEEIFSSLLSLNESFRVFQYIVIKDELFEILVIGENTITVIAKLKDRELFSLKDIDALIKKTQKKAHILESFLGEKASVDFLLIREGEGSQNRSHDPGSFERGNITSPSRIKKDLEAQNSKKIAPISKEIIEKIETAWKEGPGRPIPEK